MTANMTAQTATATGQKPRKEISAVLASFGFPDQDAQADEPMKVTFDDDFFGLSEQPPLPTAFAQPKPRPAPRVAKYPVAFGGDEEMMFPNPAQLAMWMQRTGYPMVPMAPDAWTNAGPWAQSWPTPPYQMEQAPLDGPKKRDVAVPKSKKAVAIPQQPESVKQFSKTKWCSFFQKGLCTRGTACTFAHAQCELEATPDLLKTSICLAWKAGTCAFSASACRFAHGTTYLRRAPPKQTDKRAQKLGKDLLGMLNKGASNEELAARKAQEDSFGVDDLLLIKLEEREGKESGFDHRNEDTFGAGRIDDWDYTQVLPRSPGLLPIPPGLCPPPGLELADDAKESISHSTNSGSDAAASESDSEWSAGGSTKLVGSKSRVWQ